jgi:hypothetical protein
MVRPVSAVLTAFKDDLILPSGLVGPGESCALSLFVMRFASEIWEAGCDSGAAAEAAEVSR